MFASLDIENPVLKALNVVIGRDAGTQIRRASLGGGGVLPLWGDSLASPRNCTDNLTVNSRQ